MSSKGFSIIEVLIAMAVISITAYLISHFNSFYLSRDASLRRVCESHAASIISTVQEESYYRAMANFNPTGVGAAQVPPATVFQVTTESAVDSNADYWAGLGTNAQIIAPGTAAQAPRLNNALLIQGSLRSLTALYNTNAGIRCAFGAQPRLTNRPLPRPLAELSVPAPPVVTMQLQPYNAATNAILCGASQPAVTFAAPRGIFGMVNTVASGMQDAFGPESGNYVTPDDRGTSLDTIVNMNPLVANPGATVVARQAYPAPNPADGNLGMLMSVRIQYVDKGEPQTCIATQKFEYPVDRTPPPTPDIAEVVTNNTLSGSPTVLRDVCATNTMPTTGAAQLLAGYSSALQSEGGVQLLCRDLSWIRTPTEFRPCLSEAGVVIGQQPYDANADQFQRADDPGFPNYPYDFTPNFNLRERVWQACTQLRQCGQLPVATADARLRLGHLLTYSALPNGCVMNFEVAAVDTAGNRSGVKNNVATKRFLQPASTDPVVPATFTSTAFSDAGPPPVDLNFTAQRDEIYYPTCGNNGYFYYRSGLGKFCDSTSPPYATGFYKCGPDTCGPTAQWVNAPVILWIFVTGHSATCATVGLSPAADQGYGVCASGRRRPTQGGNWGGINYIFGTAGGGFGTGGAPSFIFCYGSGQPQTATAEDITVSWLCE